MTRLAGTPSFSGLFFSILLESFRFEDKDDCSYEIFSVLSSARACAGVKSFIILLSGEGLISFSVNNCTNFFGEKTLNEAFRGVFSFENTRKNLKLNLVLALFLKSKALY